MKGSGRRATFRIRLHSKRSAISCRIRITEHGQLGARLYSEFGDDWTGARRIRGTMWRISQRADFAENLIRECGDRDPGLRFDDYYSTGTWPCRDMALNGEIMVFQTALMKSHFSGALSLGVRGESIDRYGLRRANSIAWSRGFSRHRADSSVADCREGADRRQDGFWHRSNIHMIRGSSDRATIFREAPRHGRQGRGRKPIIDGPGARDGLFYCRDS